MSDYQKDKEKVAQWVGTKDTNKGKKLLQWTFNGELNVFYRYIKT